jgi:hypothetical protein
LDSSEGGVAATAFATLAWYYPELLWHVDGDWPKDVLQQTAEGDRPGGLSYWGGSDLKQSQKLRAGP